MLLRYNKDWSRKITLVYGWVYNYKRCKRLRVYRINWTGGAHLVNPRVYLRAEQPYLIWSHTFLRLNKPGNICVRIRDLTFHCRQDRLHLPNSYGRLFFIPVQNYHERLSPIQPPHSRRRIPKRGHQYNLHKTRP